MALRLIYEETWNDIEKEIIEEADNKKSFYISSPHAIQCEEKNRNGRIYPFSTVSKEVSRYLKENVLNGTAWGELGHPEGKAGVKINEERISHRFTELKQNPIDKNYFSIKAKILETPLGNLVRALLSEGGKLGISTRCLGSIKESGDGSQVVGEDLHMLTAGDIVCQPSAQKAFVSGIYENAEYEFINGVIVEAVKNTIDKGYKELGSKEDKQKALLEGFNVLVKYLKESEK